MFTFGSVDFSQDADVVAEREAIMAEEYAREAAEEAAKSHAKISADIIQVTVAEYLALELTARNRGECPCLTCLVGEGDLLCVGCHYKYAVAGELCTKCYAYELSDEYYPDDTLDSFTMAPADARWEARRADAAIVNALGEAFGVVDAFAKYEAELIAEADEMESAFVEAMDYQLGCVDQFATANGRVYIH